MGWCRLGITYLALLVSVVYESTSEQRGNNKLVGVGYVALRRALTNFMLLCALYYLRLIMNSLRTVVRYGIMIWKDRECRRKNAKTGYRL